MQAIAVRREAGGAVSVAEQPLPSLHRDGGTIDPMPYRLQASGALPLPVQNLAQSSGLTTIWLSDGDHDGLFDLADDSLVILLGGTLKLAVSGGHTADLAPGDVLRVACNAVDGVTVHSAGDCSLARLGIAAAWPGIDADAQDAGSLMPRAAAQPLLKRMDKGDDERSYFGKFANFLPREKNVWSVPVPVSGYRFLRFPDGAFIDWHPEVVNNLAIFLSGEMEIELRGGGTQIDYFRAGDVLLAADRTGEGHIDRMHGVIHLALIVIEDADLWPLEEGTGT